ncbi:WhiB family transcriptional regulator [Streptomyces subrutilus]|uniref:WhiB family transcriptional regulator n=1 Tax=Streptomyces subrutilus TaxID=36818 RepID=UPI002E105C67|nr:WhiB family transcriptional regulator [Streptomyces subrutilus]
MNWPTVPAWTADGMCAQTDPDEFFPEKGESDKTRAAKRICQSCLVREQCLDAAMASEGNRSASGRFGVWGGYSPKERVRLAQVRSRLRMDAA